MDTISLPLLRRKSHPIRIKKGLLAKILISIEIVGILLMAWYLRVPLIKKYLEVKPKAYTVSSFKPEHHYLLAQNDFVVGTAPPGSKMKLIFNPGRQKRTVKVSDQGNWVAQLPKTLDQQRYRLTLANFNPQNQLTSVTSFKIRIQSGSYLGQNTIYKNILKPLLPKSVQAQTISFDTLPEYKKWVEQLQKLGIYPYCELNAEISPVCSEETVVLITDALGYESVCLKNPSCLRSSTASKQLSVLVDPILAKAISQGQTVPYIRPISDLLDRLVKPPSQISALAEDLSSTIEELLSEDELALLATQDGKQPRFIPYVDLAPTPQNDF